MKIKIGTFNLNNLFSRFNFKANIEGLKSGSDISYTFERVEQYKIKTFQGRLVKPKSIETSLLIAERIKSIDPDILCVQEVEDIGVLKNFNSEFLNNLFKYEVLIEGNDPRLIDVGLLSKFPIGPITSWKEAREVEWEIDKPVFGRDLLQVEILDHNRSNKLFTLFNTHMKSNFVPYYSPDPGAEALANNERRRQQAKAIANIIKSVTRPSSSFILTGDMNDTPDSEFLKPFTEDAELNLHNALQNPVELGEMNYTKYPPENSIWTHRYSPGAGIYEYHLYDQIWISKALKDNFTGGFIGRRTKVGGDGSDHDPAWIELEF